MCSILVNTNLNVSNMDSITSSYTIAEYTKYAIGYHNENLADSIQRLSSGNKISRAADDVASLSVSTSLTTSVISLKAARNNTLQANTQLQITDNGFNQIQQILERMSSIAVTGNSGSLTNSERGFLNLEFQQLKEEIDRIANNTRQNISTLTRRNLRPPPRMLCFSLLQRLHRITLLSI